ncbi:hypothetical protein CERSUDRAFT_113468 [Gelatoporia subvermispora B]|uniref:Glycylpeptide N-tetradecanoyltransferase n=1 Tax=Ceriporiopsis subvermispora (strain B) TaxID=914234 RepID=M2RHL2_CERS8|nr:hypothetical protein CERSUDRAFT_113468 [Gelatoporia subvermispora B]
MSAIQKSKEKETAEPVEQQPEDDVQDSSGSDDSGSEAELPLTATLPEASTAPTASKKKKKKRSKAAKALTALRGHKDGIPQELVNVVLEKVREQGGQAAAEANEQTIRLALEQMKIKDVIQGKAGIGGKGKKDMGDHKFWGAQPVPQPGEGPPLGDGYIEASKPSEEVRQDPYPLPKDFEWSVLDLNDAAQLRELYELLCANYVEDDNASFRFQYSAEFLSWALKPPGYHQEWHVGVRVASNKKLVAFISAIPITIRVRDHLFHASEVNFLCVHKKLRSKRLAPVLIKEITRQCHLKGIFQALYTAGLLLPTPVSTTQYYHRCINIPKLVAVKFFPIPASMTVARLARLYKVPERPHLLDSGLREMEERDVSQVGELFARYMRRFGMVPVFSLDEVRHHFLSGMGEGPRDKDSWKSPREGQVVFTYVVENPQTHKITDFFSFYSLPSTIMNSDKHSLLNAAYLYYYATDAAFEEGADEKDLLKKRLEELLGDAVIIASASGFDVLNGLTLMDNVLFMKDLKFGTGDGVLNYYLYNWRTAPLAGMSPIDDVPAGRGVGVVML